MDICVVLGDVFKEAEFIGEVDRNKQVRWQFLMFRANLS